MVLWVRGDKWGVIGMIDQLELLLSRWPEVQVAFCGKSDHRANGVLRKVY